MILCRRQGTKRGTGWRAVKKTRSADLRVILRYCGVRVVRLISQDWRALHLIVLEQPGGIELNQTPEPGPQDRFRPLGGV